MYNPTTFFVYVKAMGFDLAMLNSETFSNHFRSYATICIILILMIISFFEMCKKHLYNCIYNFKTEFPLSCILKSFSDKLKTLK